MREQVVPRLRELQHARVWLAGCATGEEAYSLAIVLHEEQVLSRCRIYATDINRHALKSAHSGIYEIRHVTRTTHNYRSAGGRSDFSDYYAAHYDHVVMARVLRRAIAFSFHDLVSDPPIADMELVLCRNVMIYFEKELSERVLHMFDRCLHTGGFIGLGGGESLSHRGIGNRYRQAVEGVPLYRKQRA